MYYIYIEGNNRRFETYTNGTEVENRISELIRDENIVADQITVIRGVDILFTVTPMTGPSVRLQLERWPLLYPNLSCGPPKI